MSGYSGSGGGGVDLTARLGLVANTFNDLINNAQAIKGLGLGFVDELVNETGVDTAASVNQTYDATNDLYSNVSLPSLIPGGTGAGIGDLTASGGLPAAFDGVTVQVDTASAHKGGGTGTGNVGKDWGLGITKTITKFELFASSNLDLADSTGPTTVSVKLQGSADNFGASIVDLYTDATYSSAAAGILTVTSGITTTTAYRYHRVLIEVAGANITVAELHLYDGGLASLNMALISSAWAITAAVNSGQFTALLEPIDPVVLGSDFNAYISNDGGTTWVATPLTDYGDFSTGIKTIAGTATFPAAGTSLVAKIVSSNLKQFKLHGWSVLGG